MKASFVAAPALAAGLLLAGCETMQISDAHPDSTGSSMASTAMAPAATEPTGAPMTDTGTGGAPAVMGSPGTVDTAPLPGTEGTGAYGTDMTGGATGGGMDMMGTGGAGGDVGTGGTTPGAMPGATFTESGMLGGDAGVPQSGRLPDTAPATTGMAMADMDAAAQPGAASMTTTAGAGTSPAGATDTTVATSATAGMMGAAGAASATATSDDASGLAPLDPMGASALAGTTGTAGGTARMSAGTTDMGGGMDAGDDTGMMTASTDMSGMSVGGAGFQGTAQSFTGQVVRQGDEVRFVPDNDTSRAMRLTSLENRAVAMSLADNETDLTPFEGQRVTFEASDVDGDWIYGVEPGEITTAQ